LNLSSENLVSNFELFQMQLVPLHHGADISCQPPEIYAMRFQKFIDGVVVEPEKDGQGAPENGGGGEGAREGASSGPRSLEVELAAVAK
jgi:hypothetical protein